MNAAQPVGLHFAPMQESDLPRVLAIENAAYAYPWSEKNFRDSLASGYHAWLLQDAAQQILGYLVQMDVLDEAHLLTVAVDPALQGTGLGRRLMDQALALARGNQMLSILLEVRPGNTRARQMYARYGFEQIGVRKGYYPAAEGRREDALVLRLTL